MELKNKKILATGLCGFIGTNLTKHLIKENVADLVVIDKLTYAADRTYHDSNNIRIEELDIASPEAYKLILDYKPDIIINLAAESHVDNSITNPNIFVETNVMGTVNLLNAAIKMEAMPLFYHQSTDEVYGDVLSGASSEEDNLVTSSPYSASKAAAEMFVQAYARTYKLQTAITRASNNYGPYQHAEKLIPKAISKLLLGEKIPVYDAGQNMRNWIHVDDCCTGILAALKYDLYPNCVFNIGGNDVITNLDIITKLCFILDRDFKDSVKFVTDRPGHDFRYSLNSTYLRSVTNWAPRISLDLGLVKTVEWYKNK